MLFRPSLQRLASKPSALVSSCRSRITPMTVRWASVNSQPTTTAAVLPWNATAKPMVVNDSLTAHVATLRPFSVPPAPTLQQPIQSPLVEEGMQLTSTLRKRRLKMNKHKHKKLRKRTRALRKRLGK